MIRQGHFFYDLRELLGSARVMIGLAAVAGFFVLFVSLSFVYLFLLLFAALLVGRALIGRRCPRCDGPLKESGAERDKHDAFVMYINWRCPKDGYTEKEKVRGDSGLFGAK
ncbi:MAG: hypothetical protein D6768_20435 [Chloroflexi bacterium]|nr:MAG: hypothetical protein D6768_20435 [Chloroflexota bacterium]